MRSPSGLLEIAQGGARIAQAQREPAPGGERLADAQRQRQLTGRPGVARHRRGLVERAVLDVDVDERGHRGRADDRIVGGQQREGRDRVGLGAAEIAAPLPGGGARAERARVDEHRAPRPSLLDAEAPDLDRPAQPARERDRRRGGRQRDRRSREPRARSAGSGSRPGAGHRPRPPRRAPRPRPPCARWWPRTRARSARAGCAPPPSRPGSPPARARAAAQASRRWAARRRGGWRPLGTRAPGAAPDRGRRPSRAPPRRRRPPPAARRPRSAPSRGRGPRGRARSGRPTAAAPAPCGRPPRAGGRPTRPRRARAGPSAAAASGAGSSSARRRKRTAWSAAPRSLARRAAAVSASNAHCSQTGPAGPTASRWTAARSYRAGSRASARAAARCSCARSAGGVESWTACWMIGWTNRGGRLRVQELRLDQRVHRFGRRPAVDARDLRGVRERGVVAEERQRPRDGADRRRAAPEPLGHEAGHGRRAHRRDRRGVEGRGLPPRSSRAVMSCRASSGLPPVVRAHSTQTSSPVSSPRLPRTSSAIAAGLSGGGRTAVSGSCSISLVRASGAAAVSPVRTREDHAGRDLLDPRLQVGEEPERVLVGPVRVVDQQGERPLLGQPSRTASAGRGSARTGDRPRPPGRAPPRTAGAPVPRRRRRPVHARAPTSRSMLGASSPITTPSANSRSITPPRARSTAIPAASASSAASPSKRALADPGRALDHHDRARAGRRGAERTADLLQLGLALQQVGSRVRVRRRAAEPIPTSEPRTAKPTVAPRSEARPGDRSVGGDESSTSPLRGAGNAIRAVRRSGVAGA